MQFVVESKEIIGDSILVQNPKYLMCQFSPFTPEKKSKFIRVPSKVLYLATLLVNRRPILL